MKKRLRGYYKTYPALKLFSKDLDEIAEIFAAFDGVEITAGEYELARISEIADIDEDVITEFHISDARKQLVFEVARGRARLFAYPENDVSLRGLAARIDEILTRRKSTLRFLRPAMVFFSGGLGVLMGAVLSNMMLVDGPIDRTQLLLPLVGLGVWLILVGFFLAIVYGRISLHRIYTQRRESDSFGRFVRKRKNQIYLAILSAIGGGVVTLSIQWLLSFIEGLKSP